MFKRNKNKKKSKQSPSAVPAISAPLLLSDSLVHSDSAGGDSHSAGSGFVKKSGSGLSRTLFRVGSTRSGVDAKTTTASRNQAGRTSNAATTDSALRVTAASAKVPRPTTSATAPAAKGRAKLAKHAQWRSSRPNEGSPDKISVLDPSSPGRLTTKFGVEEFSDEGEATSASDGGSDGMMMKSAGYSSSDCSGSLPTLSSASGIFAQRYRPPPQGAPAEGAPVIGGGHAMRHRVPSGQSQLSEISAFGGEIGNLFDETANKSWRGSGAHEMNGRVTSGFSKKSDMSSSAFGGNMENFFGTPSSPFTSNGAGYAFREDKSNPVLSERSNDIDVVRSNLSRAFGRKAIPESFHLKWSVRISDARWDRGDGRYKYKVDLTKNPLLSSHEMSHRIEDGLSTSRSQSTFTSGTTTRSLQDFLWLEQALRAEYHGALLIPLLSLALYFGPNTAGNDPAKEDGSVDSSTVGGTALSAAVSRDSLVGREDDNLASISLAKLGEKMDRNAKVEKNVLADWLSDVLNGVRGQGEFLMDYPINVIESEALETFLFRHSEPLKAVSPSQMGNGSTTRCRTSILGSPLNIFGMGGEGGANGKEGCKSVFEDFMQNPFECFGSDNACVDFSSKTSNAGVSVASPTEDSYYTTPSSRKMPLGSMMCSSGATGVPGIQPCTSNLSASSQMNIDFAGFPSSNIATHSELLEAEKGLIASYLRSSSLVIAKAHSLKRKEVYIGSCWNELAISLSKLFVIEKDLESANFGDQIKSSKRKQPFRKLRKSVVDDGLKGLARRKMDRSSPSLHALTAMMNAHYADLNAAVPAFKEYSDAIDQLQQLDKRRSHRGDIKRKNSEGGVSTNTYDGGGDWQQQFEKMKLFTSMKLVDVTKQITGISVNTATTSNTSVSYSPYDDNKMGLSAAQASVLQSRVVSNERMLKIAITNLCKATAFRNARMAWLYFKTEAKHASNVHTAAKALRQTLSIDADTVITMRERGYDVKEKEDDEKELDLVRRILELGNQNVGNLDTTARCESALTLASDRVGRWNAKVALAIMEAAGVEDAEVQVDETSRELRHARKYAILLRNALAKCIEAAEALSETVFPAEGDPMITGSRKELLSALSTVLSGRLVADDTDHHMNGSKIATPSTRVLSSVGIDTSDRGGWLVQERDNLNQRRHQPRRCGKAAQYYLKKQDNQANVLISRVLKLLKDYKQRLEKIESFVYMHCVGIQLEKHYSKVRSKALAVWERKTDISTAINVATKKRMSKLVTELRGKLEALPEVSHTAVINMKASHLTSKALKTDLHKLANCRFVRVQEVSTERVIAIMSLWSKHEVSVAIEEVKALGQVVQEVEQSVQGEDIGGGSNAFDLVQENKGLQPKVRNKSLLI